MTMKKVTPVNESEDSVQKEPKPSRRRRVWNFMKRPFTKTPKTPEEKFEKSLTTEVFVSVGYALSFCFAILDGV
jgi:hypothetical protein